MGMNLQDRCSAAIESAIAPLVGKPHATKAAILLAIREAWVQWDEHNDLTLNWEAWIEWESQMNRILPLRFPELYGRRGK